MDEFIEPKRIRKKGVDVPILVVTLLLLFSGFFIFLSASFGLLTRNGASISGIIFNQLLFGIVLGGIACFITSMIPYKFWRRYSFYFFVFSIIVTLLVFIPGVGFSHAGATRWLSLGPVSFQPAELLKIASAIYLSAWLASVKKEIGDFRFGLIPFLGFLAIIGMILLKQPDTGTFLSIVCASMTMFIVAGGKWRDVFIIVLVALLGFSTLVFMRPYVMDRVMTFMNPELDPLGSSYQIQQSLIAIGSGNTFGRGFGQSVQKFNYLPEPVGDSIFAVAGEEFGFLGGSLILILFLAFGLRGLSIAKRAPDNFSGILVSGIVALIIFGSFLNIASMLAVFPLSGQPLIFVSQGGSALLIALFSVGILLNISRHAKN